LRHFLILGGIMDTMQTARTIGERKFGPGRLSVFIKAAQGAPFEEGILRAGNEGQAAAPHKKIGQSLARLDEYLALKAAFVCWTGTMAAYAAPGKSFREASERIQSLGDGYFLIYSDHATKNRYLFQIPEEHLDKKDSILVLEPHDYSLERDGPDRIIRAAKAGLIEGFPPKNGWCPAEKAHGLPSQGGSTDFNIYLERAEMMVAPVADDYGRFPFADRRRVLLNKPPSERLGMITEPL
jgi:hypothetical protein